MGWQAVTIRGQAFDGTSWGDAARRAFGQFPRIRKVELFRWDPEPGGGCKLGWHGWINRRQARETNDSPVPT